MKLSEFKRKVKEKELVFELIEHYGKSEIPERLQGLRFILKSQNNGFYLTHKSEDRPQGSWFEYPPATLMECDGDTLVIYSAGIRDITKEEDTALKEWCDIEKTLPPYANPYWREEMFFKLKNMEYMTGHKTTNGKRYLQNKKVLDNAVKGQPILKYKLYEAKQ